MIEELVMRTIAAVLVAVMMVPAIALGQQQVTVGQLVSQGYQVSFLGLFLLLQNGKTAYLCDQTKLPQGDLNAKAAAIAGTPCAPIQ